MIQKAVRKVLKCNSKSKNFIQGQGSKFLICHFGNPWWQFKCQWLQKYAFGINYMRRLKPWSLESSVSRELCLLKVLSLESSICRKFCLGFQKLLARGKWFKRIWSEGLLLCWGARVGREINVVVVVVESEEESSSLGSMKTLPVN